MHGSCSHAKFCNHTTFRMKGACHHRWGSVFLGLPADDMKDDEEKEFVDCLKLNVMVKDDFGKQEFIDSFALIQH